MTVTTFAISFTAAKLAVPLIRDAVDLLLGVEATLALAVEERLIFTEPMFPIVELRTAIRQWVPSSGDFEFESMESDERGLVWFRQQPSGRWRVGSLWQDDIAPDELTEDDVMRACQNFVEAVDSWVRENLAVEVDDVLAS